MNDMINDIPLNDFMEAINRNIKEGNNKWVDETLKKFAITDEKAILKRNKEDGCTKRN